MRMVTRAEGEASQVWTGGPDHQLQDHAEAAGRCGQVDLKASGEGGFIAALDIATTQFPCWDSVVFILTPGGPGYAGSGIAGTSRVRVEPVLVK